MNILGVIVYIIGEIMLELELDNSNGIEVSCGCELILEVSLLGLVGLENSLLVCVDNGVVVAGVVEVGVMVL